MDLWYDFMNNQQLVESVIIKHKLKKAPVDKETPIDITYYVESDGLCPCPICDKELDLYSLIEDGEDCQCPNCGQHYKIDIGVS